MIEVGVGDDKDVDIFWIEWKWIGVFGCIEFSTLEHATIDKDFFLAGDKEMAGSGYFVIGATKFDLHNIGLRLKT